MILDTSAVVAILLREPGYEGLLETLSTASEAGIGAPTLVEAAIVLSARTGNDSRGLLSRFLTESGVITIPMTDAHWSTAVDAWLRFGKGRHPAALNFGDCLAFATARVSNRPLLCVGNDFTRTDLQTAP